MVYAVTNGLTQVQYTVAATGLTSATTPAITYVDPSTPTLALVSFPTSPTAQAPFQVEIEALAIGGARVTDPADISLTIEAGPAGAVLGGTTTVTAVNGLATFSDLNVSLAGAYTFRAESNGFSSLVTTPLTVGAALPPQINILTLPNNPQTSTNLAFSVEVLGPDLQRVTSATNVTIGAGSFPGGSVLSGTTTVATVNGVATFSDIQVTQTGSHTFTFSSAGATTVTSSAITVTQGPQPTLALQTPTGPFFEENNFSLVVDVRDLSNNAVANQPVTVALSSGAGTLSGTTTVNSDGTGTATFTGLQVSEPGDHVFTISSSGFPSINSSIITFQANPSIIVGQRIDTENPASLLRFAASQLVAGLNNVAPLGTFVPDNDQTSGVFQNYQLEGNANGSLVWASQAFSTTIQLFSNVEQGTTTAPVRSLLSTTTNADALFTTMAYSSVQDLLITDLADGVNLAFDDVALYRNAAVTSGSTAANTRLTGFLAYQGGANSGFVRGVAYNRNSNSIYVLQAQVDVGFNDIAYSVIRFDLDNASITAGSIPFTNVDEAITPINYTPTTIGNVITKISYSPDLDRLFLTVGETTNGAGDGRILFVNNPDSLTATTVTPQVLTNTGTPLVPLARPFDVVYSARADRLYVTDVGSSAVYFYDNASAITATAQVDPTGILQGGTTTINNASGLFLVP